jgi:PAS domain S-box-containing protein
MTIEEDVEREAARALRRSEARFRSLVLATSQTVWITTPEGVVEDSPSWRAFSGQTLEEYRGLGWLDAIHPDDRAAVWESWCKARDAEAPHEVEYRARRHDGIYRHLLVRAAPVVGEDGRIDEWIGATSDITERKEAEMERARLARELARKQRLLETVLQHMPAGLVVVDTRGGVQLASSVFNAITGLDVVPGDLLQDAVRGRIFEADGTPGVLEARPLARSILRGEVVDELEMIFERPDGRRVVVSVSSAPLRGPEGGIEAAVAIYQDVTERKQSDRFRELFVGMLGHDLRNPLACIATGAGLLLQRGALSPDDARVAERIDRAGDRMKRMIDQILDLTRSRLGGGIPVVPLPVELHDLVRRIVAELEAAHPGRTIRLSTSGEPRWQCDADRLGQAISNLVGNALEHTDPADPVDVSVTQPGAEVRIAVHNGGSPIPAELLGVMFDPFRSCPATRAKRASPGLGLGLYISQQIVASHGGRIEVTSSAEAGTTFTVILPASA